MARRQGWFAAGGCGVELGGLLALCFDMMETGARSAAAEWSAKMQRVPSKRSWTSSCRAQVGVGSLHPLQLTH